MKLSVVIATFNRRDLLARTLERVFAQDLRREDYEIVVVVDGSTDGTLDLLGSVESPCPFQVLEQPNRGQAAALNSGVAAARGEIVLFLDDDILCDSSLLREHLAARGDGERVVVFGPVRVAPESPPTLAATWTRRRTDDYGRWLTSEIEPRWPYVSTGDANSSMPRAAFVAAGGFDERFVGARDDMDLGLRLWKSGIRFRYCPTAVVHQVYVKTADTLVRMDARRYGANELRLCRKHPDYRPHSALARVTEGPVAKRVARETAMRLPVSPEPLLRPPFWLVERMPRTARLLGAGIRLLQARMAIVTYRSALREVGSWGALQKEFGIRLPVLLYHDIAPRKSARFPSLTVSPARFERHVRWLSRRGYVGITPSDWLAWRDGRRALPPKPVLFTFDDAYADIATYALPVLRRYGFGAAVFVITGRIGGTTWDGAPLMAADEIRHWSSEGIEFGAHTRTHPDLRRLPPSEIESEVKGSARDLEQLLARPVVSFAYPYGDYDDLVLRHVASAFDLAFTTDKGLNTLGTDLHLLRRTMVQANDSLVDLESRLRVGWSPYERLRARVRLRTRLKRAAGLRSRDG